MFASKRLGSSLSLLDGISRDLSGHDELVIIHINGLVLSLALQLGEVGAEQLLSGRRDDSWTDYVMTAARVTYGLLLSGQLVALYLVDQALDRGLFLVERGLAVLGRVGQDRNIHAFDKAAFDGDLVGHLLASSCQASISFVLKHAAALTTLSEGYAGRFVEFRVVVVREVGVL